MLMITGTNKGTNITLNNNAALERVESALPTGSFLPVYFLCRKGKIPLFSLLNLI